jgi:hypothetical protein
MDRTRRCAIVSLLASSVLATAQDDSTQHLPQGPPDESQERRLPDGRSQNDAIAKQRHEEALKDARQLVTLAEQVRDEVEKAGRFVVPITTIKKTEEIEKLARKIRGRLKE